MTRSMVDGVPGGGEGVVKAAGLGAIGLCFGFGRGVEDDDFIVVAGEAGPG